ncbi:MAG: cell surface protein SprA [Candidatus Symbiothrix sp.]|jgi:cell surface protein SprA|nr:cell surface protein SprA [Candidatus Symbiothrix sp.]
MKRRNKYIITGLIVLLTGICYQLNADLTAISSQFPEVTAVPNDTAPRFPVAPIIPQTYEELNTTHPIDLQNPEDFDDTFEYNPETNRYELRTKIGGTDVTTPLSLTRDEYLKYTLQKSMDSYFKTRNDEEFANQGEGKKDALSMFDFNFDLGPAEKIFGPGGVRLQPQGSVNTKIGVTHTSTGDPTMTERQRNHTTFDFDPQIQANVNASIGDKMSFDLNYNTESTFDFDSKRLKLAYAGKEDEIVKVLEAGNVSMNTTNSLIRGGAALFGIKTELQFGKLTVGAIFSQQESQSRSTSSKGSVQTTPFEITVDDYDEWTHFFLGHYFTDTYDEAMSTLPAIKSGISISRIEVWVTNNHSNYDEARNVVAFADLGEHTHISNPVFRPASGNENIPYNRANNLYTELIEEYPAARNKDQVKRILENGNLHLKEREDFERIEKARKLEPSEYRLNPQLGYISLRTRLQPNDLLAVAYEYSYRGNTYQVGEFSTDNPEKTEENLYLKLLKGDPSPTAPGWNLMMKNVYTISNRNIEKEKFRLDIKCWSEGVYLNYITEGAIANQLLLRVENLDRLDSREEPHPDGFFDFVEGFTALSQEGKIIFPVVQPFGEYLRKKIADDRIANEYVYQELYDASLTDARQVAEKNRFILTGEYKGNAGREIELDGGYNIAKGSVTVTANGIRLKENIDYTMNNGRVTIINPAYENADIQTSYENQNNFGMQRKTMMGLNLNYAFSPKFNLGATVMNLSEMPVTMKTNPGEESINNTLFGFNTNYSTQSQWLTNMVDKLPLVELSAPSQITFSAEYAQLIPGHYHSKWGGDYSYIDDFESAKRTIDLRSYYSWFLSATPSTLKGAKDVDSLSYGNNRALLAWYSIDPLFTRKSSQTPSHIKNDVEQLSNHYVREIREEELFPNKDIRFDEASTIPILNLAYYPKERGPYNLDREMNSDGTLRNPEDRWGGIFRKIESSQTDFEAENIEHIEFWLLDPFIYEPNSPGGDLYFNLGDVSEDILKDEKKFFENGLPADGDESKVTKTVWGYVPKQQSLVYAFDSDVDRRKQDVGLNGLSTEQERTYPAYSDYLAYLKNSLNPDAYDKIWQDPAADNYHYFRGSDYDRDEVSILGRYKHYNGTEGNSETQENSSSNYSTAAKVSPDVEDINQDNTLNENEKYFQYKVSIRPKDLKKVGDNFIVDTRKSRVTLKNGKQEEVTWYQFKIPIRKYEDNPGNIRDFQSIRFVRMFLTNFADSVILRFGTLELVRGDWRVYTKDLSDPTLPPNGTGNLSLSTVNIEENGDKVPVNYIMPPGVNRMTDPGQPQLIMQNEQSLSAKITNLSPKDARAIYKNTGLDTRQYKRLQMFVHAERLADEIRDLQDNDLSVFLRLGSDYKNNYYEYEIPLKITPPAPPSPGYSGNNNADRETVWPHSNMFDFPFELLTNLKLERNKEKRKAGSDVTFDKPYPESGAEDPQKPMNKVRVMGNPSISDIKVIMIGVRNTSGSEKSAEIWVDELRLTEFNEDGGWAGNANLFVGLSDLGSVNVTARKETAGFGSLDQGIMDRNLDDKQNFSVSTQVELGKFFPEKAKVSIPLYYSYSEDLVSPKYNPLDQDILLKDALDAVETKAEKDSIRNFAVDKVIRRSFDLNNVRVNIMSKTPMPYDPANFSLGYSSAEEYIRNATTEYDRQTKQRLLFNYLYSPMFKPWKPFYKDGKAISKNKFLSDFQIGYLPKSIEFNSDMNREYFELQLRDLGNLGENMIPASFREDFYWNRTSAISWDLTKNLRFNLNTGTNARIDAPYIQANKKFVSDSEYTNWKDSVMQSIRDWGTPMEYLQHFTATYQLPFNSIPLLNFITGNLSYNAQYEWQRGAVIDSPDIEIGNTITNERTMGLDNIAMNLVTFYNKNKFLEKVNKKYVLSKGSSSNLRNNTRRTAQSANERNQKAAEEKLKKKYEGEVQLNTDSATLVKHSLDNKRIRVTARGADGKLYNISYKKLDGNTIRINNRDSVDLKLNISQLPPLDNEQWYKIAQGVARGLMMVRNVGFSYNQTQGMNIPNFRPEIGDFFGQGSSNYGSAPGIDFAFGLTGESYLQKADENGWLVKDQDNNVSPAIFMKAEMFSFTALVEPFVGMKINLTANRTSTNQTQIDFMYDGMPRRFSGNFSMTTVALGSAFEKSDANNGYYSKAFQTFLNNRSVIANRWENIYEGVAYPRTGFLAGTNYGTYEGGEINRNSADVLVPAFLAAYTNKKPETVGLDFFPSLLRLLPNWKATYEGLIQLPFINKHFKSFAIEHEYKCRYNIGSYSSFQSWVGAGDSDGIGFIRNVTTDSPMPSSPYDITAVSIVEAFDPLIRLNSVLLNNMSIKAEYKTARNVNLNISSYQIVEMNTKDFGINLGYRFENFNKVLNLPKTGGANFNNELKVSAGITYRKMHSLIRKIQDASTQPTSGDTQTVLNLTADYTMSKMVVLQAFFDRQISKPLVSATAYPVSKSAFGVTIKVSLAR